MATGTLEFGLLAITSILAIMNPVSTVAVFYSLTADMDEQKRRIIIGTSMKIGLSVLVFFALSGQLLFLAFGLTLPAFKIAGGLLLLIVALGMFRPRKEVYSAEDLENIAVVPIAFPLTCGAGTITAVILLASEAQGIPQNAMVYLAIVLAIGVTYFGLREAQTVLSFLGEQEIRVLVKLLSIFVFAIGVQFLLTGVGEALPQIVSNLPSTSTTLGR